MKKRVLSILLAVCCLAVGAVPMGAIPAKAANKSAKTIWQKFIVSDEYLEYTKEWSEFGNTFVPKGYAIIDIDGDDWEELIINSNSDGFGFTLYTAFACDQSTGSIKNLSIERPYKTENEFGTWAHYCYELRYSQKYHALFYQPLNNGTHYADWGYWTLENGRLSVSLNLQFDGYQTTPVYQIVKDGKTKKITAAQYQAYIDETIFLNFQKISDLTEADIENAPAGEIRFSTNVGTSCIAKDTTFEVWVGDYVDNVLQAPSEGNRYVAEIGNDQIATLKTDGWNDTYGQHFTIKAKEPGVTTLTVKNSLTGDTGTLELYVVDSESVYNFDHVPEKEVEEGKTTNFYNSCSGIVVNDFNYVPCKNADGKIDHYNVTMTVYNTLGLYGAVTAYDADGNVSDYDVIEKRTSMPTGFFESLKNLSEETTDLIALHENSSYYSGESVSKRTPISVEVPAGGYVEISNNAQSPVVMFANITGLTIDFLSVSNKLASGAGDLIKQKGVIVTQVLKEALNKDYLGEKAKDVINEWMKGEIINSGWNLTNFGDGLQNIFRNLSNSGINLAELIAEEICSVSGIASITESGIMSIIPTGPLINFLFGFSEAGEIIIGANLLNKCVNYPRGIYLYPSTFNDVPFTAYYYNAVQWAVISGVTAGTSETTFSPNAPCTRAQAVTFLWRTAGKPEPKSRAVAFADIKAGSYYEKAVQWAVENGITAGTSKTTFSPDATCDRGQIVTFLYRAAGNPSVSSSSSFADVKSGQFYETAVQWAVANNITSGTGNGKFSPTARCDRSQIVTFLYRYSK